MTMSLEAAAQAMREAMRETVKRHSLWYLVQGAPWRHCRSGLSNCVLGRRGVVPRLVIDHQRRGARHKSDRRPTRTAFLAPADLRGLVGNRWRAFHSAAGRRPSCYHSTADRVLHGRGHFETRLRPDHTALSKLGLGLAERYHRDTAVSYSMGQSSSNSRVAAWRSARH